MTQGAPYPMQICIHAIDLSCHARKRRNANAACCSKLICYACRATHRSNGDSPSPYSKLRDNGNCPCRRIQNGTSVSVDDPFWAGFLLAAWPRTRVQLTLGHTLHETDVIILREVSVFLQIWALVLWHSGE